MMEKVCWAESTPRSKVLQTALMGMEPRSGLLLMVTPSRDTWPLVGELPSPATGIGVCGVRDTKGTITTQPKPFATPLSVSPRSRQPMLAAKKCLSRLPASSASKPAPASQHQQTRHCHCPRCPGHLLQRPQHWDRAAGGWMRPSAVFSETLPLLPVFPSARAATEAPSGFLSRVSPRKSV